MTDVRLQALYRSWEKIAQELLTESKKVRNRSEKECLQHKAALHLNLANDLKTIMCDSFSSEK